MKEVAALEAQLEAENVKPKSKMSQRPKDTVKPDQSHSSIHTTKAKLVEKKQLEDVTQHLRLELLSQGLPFNEMYKLFFEPYSEDQEISIM